MLAGGDDLCPGSGVPREAVPLIWAGSGQRCLLAHTCGLRAADGLPKWQAPRSQGQPCPPQARHREALQTEPTSQPSPRTVTFAHFRGPALAVGVTTTMHARHGGQVAGGLITVITLTTHRQKLSTHGQESCVQGLSRGCSGEEDWRRRAAPHIRAGPGLPLRA